MTSSGAPRSCKNAVALWLAVLKHTKACVPAAWPQLLPPLRGAAAAARSAGGEEMERAAAGYEAEVAALIAELAPKCADVEGG